LVGGRALAGVEPDGGRRNSALLEEYPVHLVVVMLAGVNDAERQAIARAAQRARNGRNFHEIRPGARDDRYGLHPCATRSDAGCSALSSRISCLVSRMFARLEAPNTMERIPLCLHTYSSASRGGIAPEARTDIAIGRHARVPMT